MQRVLDIHSSKLYGVFVETGCSTALTSLLLGQPGASNTVYYSIQPYSKEYEHYRYGLFDRSVSKEFVNAAVDVECRSQKENPNVNFVFASSWQMSDGDSLTHGWVGIRSFPHANTYSFHFTIPKGSAISNRENIIQAIGDVSLRLVSAFKDSENVIDPNKSIIDAFSDYDGPFILDAAFIDTYTSNKSLLILMLESHLKDYPLVFGQNGPMRFEDLMRSGDEFVIEKGSFNPLHHQHVHMMDKAGELHPAAQKVFLISTYRYDKPHIDLAELIGRIDNITKHGYKVIICKEVFFYFTFRLFKNWSEETKKFYFVTGTDTINRIYEADLAKTAEKHGEPSPFAAKIFIEGMVRIYGKQFQFLVLPRTGYTLVDNIHWYDGMTEFVNDYQDDGTSSTSIRNGTIKNLLN